MFSDFTRRNDVKAAYAALASHYDRASRLLDLMGLQYDRLRSEAIDAMQLRPGDTVVELGCGTGANFPLLLEKIGPQGRIIGVDLTAEMLREAKRKIDREGWMNITLVNSSAQDYQFPDGKVDGVLSTFALTLEPEYDGVIRKISRSLRPGARFAIADLKLAKGPALVLLPFLLLLVRPFAVSLKLAERHPWESMERYLKDVNMSEGLWGYLYVATGTAGE